MPLAWNRRAGRNVLTDPFTDLLFNALLGFVFLFLIAIMFMNPVAKTGVIDAKAEYLITVRWPDGNTDDIDTWTEDPVGNIVWFKNREAGLIHLDRDDRSVLNDTIVVGGREITNPLNQEVTSIRGIAPGEYVVNIHYYASATRQPVSVTIEVAKVNPSLEVIYYGTETLQQQGAEKTAVRFTLAEDGTISGVNRIYKQLVNL